MKKPSASRYCQPVESRDRSGQSLNARRDGESPAKSAGEGSAQSVREAEFVAQDLVAMGGADVVFVEPPLAAQFARRSRLVRGHGAGDLIAQVEIATDALVVLAIEAEQGFGVAQVDGVFDLTALGHAFGVVVPEIHGQGLQLGKFIRETA